MCSAEVTLTDKNTGEVITLGDMDLNISSTLTAADVAFTNERLALNRQYGFLVNARNINGSAISTGDISKLINYSAVRPLFGDLKFSSGAFPYYSAGGRVITIIHYQLTDQGSLPTNVLSSSKSPLCI